MGKVLKKACMLVGIALTLLLGGCQEEGIIPPAEMSSLIAEFYLADASIEMAQEEGSKEMRYVDSLKVYEPILVAHGFTAEDFRISINFYLHDPKQLDKIFRHSRLQLETLAEKQPDQLDMEDAEEPGMLENPPVPRDLMEGAEPEQERLEEKAGADSSAKPKPQRHRRKKMTRDELKQLEQELKKNNKEDE